MTSIRFIAAAASLVAATPAFAAPVQPGTRVMVVATYDQSTQRYCIASIAPNADAEIRSAVRVGRCASERVWNRRGIAFHASRQTLDSLKAAPVASITKPATAG